MEGGPVESAAGGGARRIAPRPGDKAVVAALSMLGKPYVYGATAGDTSRFDCSSLVQWAWKQAGWDLPRVSVDQFLATGDETMIPLVPGDLIFYDYYVRAGRPSRGVNHVVMYIGAGNVVEASSRAGKVRVTLLAKKGRPVGFGRPGPSSPTAIVTTGTTSGHGSRRQLRRALGLATATAAGCWAAERSGRVTALGSASLPPAAPSGTAPGCAAAIAATPSGRGYWRADAGGRVFAVGDAPAAGERPHTALRAPIVAMAATPSGHGYWIADAGGRVLAFGDAPVIDEEPQDPLDAPAVAMAATPSGHGYWIADAGGRVLAFGDAPLLGNVPRGVLRVPITAMAGTSSGRGYWMASAGGRVFEIGDAPPLGDVWQMPGPESPTTDMGGRPITYGQ